MSNHPKPGTSTRGCSSINGNIRQQGSVRKGSALPLRLKTWQQHTDFGLKTQDSPALEIDVEQNTNCRQQSFLAASQTVCNRQRTTVHADSCRTLPLSHRSASAHVEVTWLNHTTSTAKIVSTCISNDSIHECCISHSGSNGSCADKAFDSLGPTP